MSITYTFHNGPPGKDYDENQIRMTGYKINKIQHCGSQWSQIVSLDVSDMKPGERITHVVMWHHTTGGRFFLQCLPFDHGELDILDEQSTLVATINIGVAACLVHPEGIR